MGLMKRFSEVMKAKTSKMLDKAEDPRETLDYSYEKQLEMVQKVRRGLADVATSRKRLELQHDPAQGLGRQAGEPGPPAVGAGREDLAREALNRRAGIQWQLDTLDTQRAQLQAEEDKLTLALQRLQTKVEAFRTKKETIKATYTAAEATAKIGEAVSGISEEMGDVGLAIQRAEDKTATLQARAGAVDELIASGALDDVTAEPGGDIQRQLDALSAGLLGRRRAGQDEGRAGRRCPGSQGARRRRVQVILRILGEGQLEDVRRRPRSSSTSSTSVLIDAVEKGDEGQFQTRPGQPGRTRSGRSGSRWPTTTSARRSSSSPAPTPRSTRCRSCSPTRA